MIPYIVGAVAFAATVIVLAVIHRYGWHEVDDR